MKHAGALLQTALAGINKIVQVDVYLGQFLFSKFPWGVLPLCVVLKCGDSTIQNLVHGRCLLKSVLRRRLAGVNGGVHQICERLFGPTQIRRDVHKYNKKVQVKSNQLFVLHPLLWKEGVDCWGFLYLDL